MLVLSVHDARSFRLLSPYTSQASFVSPSWIDGGGGRRTDVSVSRVTGRPVDASVECTLNEGTPRQRRTPRNNAKMLRETMSRGDAGGCRHDHRRGRSQGSRARRLDGRIFVSSLKSTPDHRQGLRAVTTEPKCGSFDFLRFSTRRVVVGERLTP